MNCYYKRFNNAETCFYQNFKNRSGVITSKDENGEFILVPLEMLDMFIVNFVSREDIRQAGFDANNMSDDDMKEFASNLEASILESGELFAYVNDLARVAGLDELEDEPEED